MTKNQVKMWVVGLLAGGSLLACSPKEIQTGNLNVIPLPQEITAPSVIPKVTPS